MLTNGRCRGTGRSLMASMSPSDGTISTRTPTINSRQKMVRKHTLKALKYWLFYTPLQSGVLAVLTSTCIYLSILFFHWGLLSFRVAWQSRFGSYWVIFQESVIVVPIIIMDHIKAESIILSHLFCVWIWKGTWVETLWLKRVVGDLGWRHDLYHLCVYNLQLPWFIQPH